MKRFLIVLMALLMAFMCACTANTPEKPIDDDPASQEDPPHEDPPHEDPPQTDVDLVPDSSKKLILIGTYTNNARLEVPYAEAVTTEKNVLAFVEVGAVPDSVTDVKDVMRIECLKDTSEFDELVGLPVSVGFKDGKAVSVKAAGKFIKGMASDFTSENNRYYFKGKEISVDLNRLRGLNGSRAWTQQIRGGWKCYNKSNFIFDNVGDEIYTLMDVDGDGKYDFFRENKMINALRIDLEKSQEGIGVTFTDSGSGCDEVSGWFTNGVLMPYVLKGSLAGKTLKEIGNTYLDVYIVRNNEVGVKEIGTILAMCEIYPAKTYREGDVEYVLDMADNVMKTIVPEGGAIPGIEYTLLSTDSGLQAAGVLDIQCWWHNFVSYEELKSRIEKIHAMGIRRLNIIISPPGFPTFSNTYFGYTTLSDFARTVKYYEDLGYASPDLAVPEICHNLNMQCYAVYRLYEGGGTESVPFGRKYDPAFTAFEGFDGYTVELDKFLTDTLSKGEDYRIVRRPDGANDNLDVTVDRITVDFVAGAYQQRGSYAARGSFSSVSGLSANDIKRIADGQTYTNSSQHPMYGINVWVSYDNASYTLYQGDYSYTYVSGAKQFYDANGDLMFDGAKKVSVTLEITGLEIDQKFCAVTFDSTAGLRTDPNSFMHLYSNDREVYTSLTHRVRRADFAHDNNPEDYVWGHDQTPVASSGLSGLKLMQGSTTRVVAQETSDNAKTVSRFTMYGFAFNSDPFVGKVLSNVAVICSARGAEKTFPGGFCEAYPEVREYWLSNVQTLMNYNFDGVIVRLQSHSSIATDYKNYGYNEPIVEKYKELYGQAAYDTLMDQNHHVTDEEYIRIMRIRGDYFMLFADQASELCHQNGKEFSLIVRDAYCDPIIDSSQDEVGYWCMPKVILDWKHAIDISDFAVVKDYLLSPSEIAVNAKEIRAYAKSQNKQVWIHCYDSQGGMFRKDFVEAAEREGNIDGLILYELTSINNYVNSNFGQTLKNWGFKLRK